MYITDRGNNRVQLWNTGTSIGTTTAGETLNISLNGPTTIVRDSITGIVYISDTYNRQIVSYPSGTVVAGGNSAGHSSTHFLIPNYDTNEIVRWVLSAHNWTHVAGNINGSAGSDSSSLYHPVGMTIDPMGTIYIADARNHRIQFFLAGKSNGTTIAGITDVSGNDSTLLYSSYWVALDNQLNLYVSDTFNHRVQKFLRY
ncbi:unnamed protein product [Rotaria sp. Silwood2]|nr:unnamed protein product [Rotaria sp. Silwood2]CAF4406411.1 unnamed protein product [Rotaria sp. Silwood2]